MLFYEVGHSNPIVAGRDTVLDVPASKVIYQNTQEIWAASRSHQVSNSDDTVPQPPRRSARNQKRKQIEEPEGTAARKRVAAPGRAAPSALPAVVD